jgi:hypothetical protein
VASEIRGRRTGHCVCVGRGYGSSSSVPCLLYCLLTDEEQPYKEALLQIHSDLSLSRIDPEVSLAVRVASATAVSTDIANSLSLSADEDAESIDEFAASCGFEFVDDAQSSSARTIEHEEGTSEPHTIRFLLLTSPTEVPGLPRVLDALSTIMWPSMVQASRQATRSSRPMNLLGLGAHDDSTALATLLQGAGDVDPARDLAELERWLEEDEHEGDSHGDAGSQGDGFDDLPTPGPRDRGFDDDFAAFVSAPAARAPKGSAGTRLPTFTLASDEPASAAPLSLDASFDATYDFDAPRSPLVPQARSAGADIPLAQQLAPMHTGTSWTSFSGASDAGLDAHVPLGSEAGDDGDDDDDDDDDDAVLPSDAEVRTTAARIFGPGADADAVDSGGEPNFDLSRVLASLEGMKAEIAGIADEDARRQAAARVALGLAHGLGLDQD